MCPPAPSFDLTREELLALIERVFAPTANERGLAFLVDLPDAALPDHAKWRERRAMAASWAKTLREDGTYAVDVVLYRNVRANNADLPEMAWIVDPDAMPDSADALDSAAAITMESILASHPFVIAPTQFSATAPLKLCAPRFGLRAVTMPGFSREMIPALRLDYGEIDRRVRLLKGLLDEAEEARIVFEVDARRFDLTLDLRYRKGHASGGLIRERGTAGNLPSGEAYVVPYEGEREGDPSRSSGLMPVELDGEVVIYRIERNRAIAVEPGGLVATREAAKLAREPAYGNLAELGLGVLGDFGVPPAGEILLDEKLGLHIAFGRSDHFGGQVGAKDFSSPEAVVHLDRVYVDSLQPRVKLSSVDLLIGGSPRALMRDGRYMIPF